MMDVVIVESPAKAKTIHKYLGGHYRILASFGHVRDLPVKEGSVRPDEDFHMVWEVMAKARKTLKDITSSLRHARHVYLATDPDREGEAISWHIVEFLAKEGVLGSLSVRRVVFHEITKEAVVQAFSSSRAIDMRLVEAYLARRALDYLVGFTLSPVLWRKLPGSRSAGRVQSVALRMVCDRENEIGLFRPREYWQLHGHFFDERDKARAEGDAYPIRAKLVSYGGKALGQFDLDKEKAEHIKEALSACHWHVAEIVARQEKRKPYPPFITSTLQQAASRLLGFSAKQTMTIAQKLYDGSALRSEEGGLITYMRTDSTALSRVAIETIRDLIVKDYGKAYLPSSPIVYKGKAKNAQEAHEAIRPTDCRVMPSAVRSRLDSDCYRLYELIWRRAMASQMESARMERVRVDIVNGEGGEESSAVMRANGSSILFDGFLRLYQEDKEREDGKADDKKEGRLPPLRQGMALALASMEASQHFTKPPPRFTEASLVKTLEEEGIGRPSTYASIISVLRDREYVAIESRRFTATVRGRVVSAFLDNFFHRYIQNDFTSQLEDQLDAVSRGEKGWKDLLRDFWCDFVKSIDKTKDMPTREVIDVLNDVLKSFLFGEDEAQRVCPQCKDGTLGIKLSRYGPFIGCSLYPKCVYTRAFEAYNAHDDTSDGADGKKILSPHEVLGVDPVTKGDVSLRRGPYGFYIQLERPTDGTSEGKPSSSKKPKRVSLNNLPAYPPETMTLETALRLLALPRVIGEHPQKKGDMVVSNGPYGPYIYHDGLYASLRPEDDILEVGMNRAVVLLAEAEEKRKARIIREIGTDPHEGGVVRIEKSRFGPCIVHGKQRAYLGKGIDTQTMDAYTLEDALALLAENVKKTRAKTKTKTTTRKRATGKKAGM
ncbi:MAG: type I DNA topoisomerase [Alphaproteobacteria bacterium GM7ARS4]|nr:type I DNA topoisomerase [Alphaproteobacteria bacterium GM7ARS4]